MRLRASSSQKEIAHTNMKWEKELRECHYERPADFLWFYVMNGCGCGSSDEFKELAWDVFSAFAEDKPSKWELYENPIREMVAQWLYSCGLLEHGTSIRGAWLDDEGQQLYDALKERPKSD